MSNAVLVIYAFSFALGTGKTFTAVALISLFCNINQMLSERKKVKKHFVLFCGPSNKSVDLVTGNLNIHPCFYNVIKYILIIFFSIRIFSIITFLKLT